MLKMRYAFYDQIAQRNVYYYRDYVGDSYIAYNNFNFIFSDRYRIKRKVEK